MRRESLIRDWETDSFRGREAAVRQLGVQSFSGVVVADETTVVIVNGAAIRVTNGSITDLFDAELVVHEARNPAEPYLLALYGHCSEAARLYTRETPVGDAVSELADASFSGYVELSEHVYSGDYYAVFSGGDVEFLGIQSTERPPLSGTEARDAMYGEVGIYSINRAWMDPVDLTTDPSSWHEPSVRDRPPETAGDGASGDTRIFQPGDERETGTRVFESGETREAATPDRSGDAGTPSFCPNCGADLDEVGYDALSFCPDCGFALEDG